MLANHLRLYNTSRDMMESRAITTGLDVCLCKVNLKRPTRAQTWRLGFCRFYFDNGRASTGQGSF